MRNAVPAAEAELLDFAGEPSGVVECQQTWSMLTGAIARLPANTREAFLLYRVEVYSQAELRHTWAFP
jgi:DNA-directed RNA polymerase specialized sigma24 family protein